MTVRVLIAMEGGWAMDGDLVPHLSSSAPPDTAMADRAHPINKSCHKLYIHHATTLALSRHKRFTTRSVNSQM